MGNPGMTLLAYFKQGGVAMYPLLAFSVLCVAISIERILVLQRAGQTSASLIETLRGLLSSGQVADAIDRCTKEPGPLAEVVKAALAPAKASPEYRRRALERALTRETGKLERYLPIVATTASVAPFVGLFGTVLGIMRAFRDIGAAGSAGSAVVASGIAEALITTATGLFVAVVAVIAYNHLMTWAQSIVTDTELNADELVSLLEE